MVRLVHFIALATLILALLTPGAASAAPRQQTAVPSDQDVIRIISKLTPEERVGQLFLVTFKGTATDDSTPIFELISKYHIGGAVLLAANDNFTDAATFGPSLRQLTTNLQALAAGVAPTGGTATPGSSDRQFIPLFITTPYRETNFPGVATLPSPMTLGATWNLTYTQSTGNVMGQDLAALGINLLIGPSLDVIETPQPGSPADPGVHAFGGSPYWVGKLGQAFIQGVHEGSRNHVAVVAQHFPGYGAGDRALEDQIPTVNRSREALRAIDLAPFFAVTKTGAASDTDALLISHIRYTGLQGPIGDATGPISLDKPALGALLNLPEFSKWRAAGGVTVSDALGVRAIRRFSDPSGTNFSAFAVARDAFLAGNDLLYLSPFFESGDDPAATIKTVLDQFVQKYKRDPAFQVRVNDALRRILKLKLKLYGEFAFEAVLPTADLQVLGTGADVALPATQAAATLIHAAGSLSRPTLNQRIVFFTDTRPARLCSTCTFQPSLAVDALQSEVVRLYGPRGTNEALTANLSSYSFTDLVDFLNNKQPLPTETPAPGAEGTPTPETSLVNIEKSIRSANWVVFAMQEVHSTVAESLAVRRILFERPDLLKNKQVVVFALDAPYYLDTTEVTQLSAYYALYNHTPAAVEVAARILFQEIAPNGASPVSIPAVGYRLEEALQPDPDQDIKLIVEPSPKETLTPTPTKLTPTPPVFGLGDLVTLHTSVIVDRGGHPVPDGTIVNFYVTYVTEGLKVPVRDAQTLDGVATISYRLDRAGALELSATSGLASRSDRVIFPVAGSPPTIIAPDTLTPTSTATATPPPSSPTPQATPPPPPLPPPPVTPVDLLMTLFTLIMMGGIAWRLTNSRVEAVSDGVKLFLAIAIGVLAGYNYYALKMPGTPVVSSLGFWAVPFVVWSGGMIGFGFGWWWLRRSAHR